MAVDSDVGPFPHGTQARELELMVENGMTAADVLRADLLHGARLLGWGTAIGQLKPGFYADVIAIEGNPIEDITAVTRVQFVIKNGEVFRRPHPCAFLLSGAYTCFVIVAVPLWLGYPGVGR